MELLLLLFFTIIFGSTGFIFGLLNEKRHYRSIIEREEKYQHILLFNEKQPPTALTGQPFALVVGSVVMSSDYFKQIVAGLKSILGGRLSSYESMLDRGRREAILRMKEKADQRGATMIFNVHFNTTSLNDNFNKESKLSCAEVLVYGTAWVSPKL